MSGGSWDYFYSRLNEVAARLLCEAAPDRRALGARLRLAATALHDIEWVDSCDYSKGDDQKAIMDALNPGAEAAVLDEAIVIAKDALYTLTTALAAAEAAKGEKA